MALLSSTELRRVLKIVDKRKQKADKHIGFVSSLFLCSDGFASQRVGFSGAGGGGVPGGGEVTAVLPSQPAAGDARPELDPHDQPFFRLPNRHLWVPHSARGESVAVSAF